MTDLRLYLPEELGPDGYPRAWHLRIKHDVREAAGFRCLRCKHPYRNGEHGNGEWSPCDDGCDHAGPQRVWNFEFGEWIDVAPGPAYWSEGRKVEARWRILTVHHLDGDKANCRWWNLAALCQRCHLTIQGKVRLKREFILEHSEWFKLFAAGWYAWKYERREIEPAEALARMDELLAYEQRVERIA